MTNCCYPMPNGRGCPIPSFNGENDWCVQHLYFIAMKLRQGGAEEPALQIFLRIKDYLYEHPDEALECTSMI